MPNHVTVSDEIQCKLNLHCSIHWSAEWYMANWILQSTPLTRTPINLHCFSVPFRIQVTGGSIVSET